MARSSKTTPRKLKSPAVVPKPMACRECKKQKIYCSKGRPKCERCQLRSIECVYSGPKKIKINEHNLKALKSKLRRYEEILQSLPPGVLESLPEQPTLEADDDDDDDDDGRTDDDDVDTADESLPDQLQHMSLYLRGSRGSADNFIYTARTLSGAATDDDVLQPNAALCDAGALPSRRRWSGAGMALPPVDIARQYFAAQHMYIGTIFAFTDTDAFEQQLREVYYADRQCSDVLDATASLALAKFYVILALGRMYSVNQRVSSAGSAAAGPTAGDVPPGFAYFCEALQLLPDMHEDCLTSLLGVETLAYVGYFLQNMNRRDAAFVYIGTALRLAMNLGLHQELPADGTGTGTGTGSLDASAREHRRRLWWSIYSLDRIVSLKAGKPLAIRDEDVGVALPARQPGEAADSPVVVLRSYTELSRILGDITTLIYRRTAHTGASLTAAVRAILEALRRWEEALPATLRMERDDGAAVSNKSRESISTFLHYYQCVHMTARPLLFHVVQRRLRRQDQDPATGPDWRSGLSTQTAALIGGCIAAARHTLRIMSAAAEYGLVATFGYMDSEHAISAAIVLVLVCGAFPGDAANAESLALGLALLRRMGALGNSHVAARYRLLVQLQSILGGEEGGEAEGEADDEADAVPGVSVTATDVSWMSGSSVPDISILDSQLDHYFDFSANTLDLHAGLPEESDSHMWTTAFANPDVFDIAQLLPGGWE